MPCYKPVQAWQPVEKTKNGKRKPVFKKSLSNGNPMLLPCGKCVGCRLEKSKQWAARCVHEAQQHRYNCFVTLTYRPESLPYLGSLNKKHFQLFMKRLRKRHDTPIRFFMCGEYGEQFSRPHYHALLFGYYPDDAVPWKETDSGLLYCSKKLEKIWRHGFVSIGELNYQTAAYTARYTLKKITGEKAETHYTKPDPYTGEAIPITPEYCTMSLKPGIGANWLEKYEKDVFPSDTLVLDGKILKPPRYYDQKFGEKNPEALEEIKTARMKRAERFKHDNTPDRLDEKCFVQETRVNFQKRDI